MQIFEEEMHEDYAAKFQLEMIQILNETLKKHHPPAEKRKIPVDHSHLIFPCENFHFHNYIYRNTEAVFDKEAEE